MGDTQDKINCPACGLEMEKIHLEKQDFNIDVCLNGCGGIYLDNREFKTIDEESEDITPILEAFENKTFKETDETKRKTCPVCGHEMVKNYTSHLKNIQIDECYNCGGKFLNYEQLIAIRSEFKTEKERIEAFNKFAKEKFGKNIEKETKAPRKKGFIENIANSITNKQK